MISQRTILEQFHSYDTVEQVSAALGVDKPVLRAYLKHAMPDLNKTVQNIMQAPYRKQTQRVGTAQYKKMLRGDLCAYCGKYSATKMTIDHVVPVSKGGENEASNMTAACSSCNSRKDDTSLLLFLLEEREDDHRRTYRVSRGCTSITS